MTSDDSYHALMEFLSTSTHFCSKFVLSGTSANCLYYFVYIRYVTETKQKISIDEHILVIIEKKWFAIRMWDTKCFQGIPVPDIMLLVSLWILLNNLNLKVKLFGVGQYKIIKCSGHVSHSGHCRLKG